MERLHYRSTSIVDLQAEMHERDLLREVRGLSQVPRPRRRARGSRFGLSILGRRLIG